MLEPVRAPDRPTLVRIVVLVALLATACGGSESSDAGTPPTPSPTSIDAPAGNAASFRAFAEGAEAPMFDDQVEVFVDAEAALTLTRDQARDAAAWTTDDHGSLLELASAGRVRFPPTCDVLPSPAVPLLDHAVQVREVSVLWRPEACDFAVLLVVDRDGEIAAVAFEA